MTRRFLKTTGNNRRSKVAWLQPAMDDGTTHLKELSGLAA